MVEVKAGNETILVPDDWETLAYHVLAAAILEANPDLEHPAIAYAWELRGASDFSSDLFPTSESSA